MSEPTLEQNLTAWLAEGILSEEQADAIRTRQVDGDAKTGRLQIYAQVLGYAGGAFALGVVFVVMSGHWEALGILGRLVLVGIVTAAILVAGVRAGRSESPAAAKLGEFLLFLGVISVGLLAGMVTGDFLPRDEYAMITAESGALPLVVGAGVSLVIAVAVWLKRKTAVPHVAMALSLGAFALGLISHFSQNDPFSPVGTVFFWLGVAWLVLAERGFLRPLNEAWSMGCLAIGVGLYSETIFASSTANELATGTAWFGLAISTLLLLAGARLGRGPGIGFGSVGILGFVMTLLFAAPKTDVFLYTALAAIGIALVGGAVALCVIRKRAAGKRMKGDPDGIALLQKP